jgi:lactate racemase
MNITPVPLLSCKIDLTLPDAWDTQMLCVRPGRALRDDEIDAALERPGGAGTLEDVIHNKSRIMIVVDDCMRPTPVSRIAPMLVRKLCAIGVVDDQIRFILASGMHRAQTGRDLIAKLGKEIVDRFEIVPHNPYENLVYVGKSPNGIPVWVNRWVAESDVRIGIGSVLPHTGAGFGGGGKIIMPGVCGIETVAAHHESIPRGSVDLENNAWRQEIEAIARMIGLDWIINVVLNGEAQPAGIFTGDMVVAHRKAVALATQLYKVDLPTNLDIAITSGYPMDQELAQARKAVATATRCVRPGGSVVLLGECPEGAGFHALYGSGGRFQAKAKTGITKLLGDRQVWVCSPGVSPHAARQYLPDSTLVIAEHKELIARLNAQHPHAQVCVLLQGTLLFGETEVSRSILQ